MNFLKGLSFILLFYLLALLETTFLVFFNIFGVTLNLILIIVMLWNIFESSKSFFGLYLAFIGGFFLDVFSSSSFFSYNILLFLIISFVIKMVIKDYVRIPFAQES
ncbi:MAG: hypothetical protein PHI53_00890 [Candidatus Pacebacteria bacterium]|nr:hypothetical protein [Candidatus Paceibacterota bacterium]